MLEMTCTNSMDDLVAFHTFALKRSPYLRKRLVRSWVVLPVGLVVIALVLWAAATYPPLALSVAVSGAVIALFFPLIWQSWIWQWARQLAAQNAAGGLFPTTLTLTDDVLRVRGRVTETTARWDMMVGVEAGPDHTFILVTELFAVVVPRHTLGREEDYAAVRDFALAKLAPKS